MDPIFDHRANHDLKINFNIIKGEFKFEDIVKDLDKIVHSPEYCNSYNILVDIREADFIDFNMKVSVFVDYIQNNASFFNLHCKCSFITTKPLDVAYSTLLIEKLQISGIQIQFKIFSTEEAALNWMSV